MELETNNHSVFIMYYHLVLVIKYRRKVIDDVISNRLERELIVQEFCFLSTGGVPVDVIKKYNESQGERH